jgi:amidophosphoribosyltransferase
MLREAGAREVHVRIASPPVKWPCFYGIDFATRAELVANGLSLDEIRRSIDADSLGYISLDELVAATNVKMDGLCRACFDGIYPIEVSEPTLLAAQLLEHELESAQGTLGVDGLAAVGAGGGAADALLRP